MNDLSCVLCRSGQTAFLCADKMRQYYKCAICGLIFVLPEFFPDPAEEKARYDLHRNSYHDKGYCDFLRKLFLPVNEAVPPGSCGLDFGSGPCPVLADMFADAGHRMSVFDKFYAPDPCVLERRYRFITACEVVEHLQDPFSELDRLWNCLEPGGLLGVMTELTPESGFSTQWHYARDITHLCFYSRRTLEWVAEQWNADLRMKGRNTAVFIKPA